MKVIDWLRKRFALTADLHVVRKIVDCYHLQPGDVLVLRFEGRLTREQTEIMAQQFEDRIGKRGAKLLLIEGGMRIEGVLRFQGEAQGGIKSLETKC